MRKQMALVLVVVLITLFMVSFALVYKLDKINAEIVTLKSDKAQLATSAKALETEFRKWQDAAEPALGARGISTINPLPAELAAALNPCIPMPGVVRPELCSKLDMEKPIPIRIALNEELIKFIYSGR